MAHRKHKPDRAKVARYRKVAKHQKAIAKKVKRGALAPDGGEWFAPIRQSKK